MLLRNDHLQLWKGGGDDLPQIAANRIFRIEMPGVNDGQPCVPGIPEVVVFHVGGDKGIAPGPKDGRHSPAQAPPPTAT